MKEKDISSLEHTTWRYQYHIVFAPKYRRMAIYGELRKESVVGSLKRKHSLMIFDHHGNLKCKYMNRHFWAKGYYVDMVGRNKNVIQKYVQKQLKGDKLADQMSASKNIMIHLQVRNTRNARRV